ncbi:MAG: hypothetical protein PHW14_05025 [Candidatus Omnitrophica bacterium]|nr:hypothetical protein [Candidatus Omnitrophota bacterium]
MKQSDTLLCLKNSSRLGLLFNFLICLFVVPAFLCGLVDTVTLELVVGCNLCLFCILCAIPLVFKLLNILYIGFMGCVPERTTHVGYHQTMQKLLDILTTLVKNPSVDFKVRQIETIQYNLIRTLFLISYPFYSYGKWDLVGTDDTHFLKLCRRFKGNLPKYKGNPYQHKDIIKRVERDLYLWPFSIYDLCSILEIYKKDMCDGLDSSTKKEICHLFDCASTHPTISKLFSVDKNRYCIKHKCGSLAASDTEVGNVWGVLSFIDGIPTYMRAD